MRKYPFLRHVPVLVGLVLILSGFCHTAYMPDPDPDMPLVFTDLYEDSRHENLIYELPMMAAARGSTGISTDGTTGASSDGSTDGGTIDPPGESVEFWYAGIKASENATISIVEDSERTVSNRDMKETSMVTTSVKSVQIFRGEHLCITTNSNPASQPITVYLEHVLGSSPEVEPPTADYKIWKKSTTLYWRLCDAVSVDSRKMYGPANAVGLQGLDANSPPRPVNFYGFTYKGGLNVGRMPASTLDQSGVSRIQMYATVPTAANGLKWNISLVPIQHASVGAVANLTVSSVPTTDTHYSTTPQLVTWDTKFSSGGYYDTFTGTAVAGTRLNFRSDCDGGVFPAKFSMSSSDESQPGAAWTYFVSPAYGTAHTGYSSYVPDLWLYDEEVTDHPFYSWTYISP